MISPVSVSLTQQAGEHSAGGLKLVKQTQKRPAVPVHAADMVG
jgi:hypothetical protein